MKCIDYAAVHFYGYSAQCRVPEIHAQRQARFEKCLHNKSQHLTVGASEATQSKKPRASQSTKKQF